MVAKKWTQTRDTWMRCNKKQKQEKSSGSSTKPSRLYVYHEQMSFLKKINDEVIAHESTHDNTLEGNNDKETGTADIETEIAQNNRNPKDTVQKKRYSDKGRKRTINEVDAKMISLIDHQLNLPQKVDNENRHLCFFKSLLPSLSSFDDDQTLEFQSDVLQLIQKLKRRKENAFHSGPSQMNYNEWHSGQPQSHGYFSQPQIQFAQPHSYSTQLRNQPAQSHSYFTQPQTQMQSHGYSAQPPTPGSLSEVSQSPVPSTESQDSDLPELCNF